MSQNEMVLVLTGNTLMQTSFLLLQKQYILLNGVMHFQHL